VASPRLEALIAVRVSAETKARFAALAMSKGMSESALLTRMLATVIDQNEDLRHAEGSASADVQAADGPPQRRHELRRAEGSLFPDIDLDDRGSGPATLRHAEGFVKTCVRSGDRVTLRLRPGDQMLVEARAASRGMRPASYLVALIHAHVRADPPMPRSELRELKIAVAELSATKRSLDPLRLGSHAAVTIDVMKVLHDTAARVDAVRGYVTDVVRANLVSWEAPDA
jgi:hypothetical protein